MVGKQVLVMLVYQREGSDRPEGFGQLYGTIESFSAEAGFVLGLVGTGRRRTYLLPPDLEAFKPRPPGRYVAVASGKAIADPDYAVTLTVPTAPATDIPW
jgi:hypothetical protein